MTTAPAVLVLAGGLSHERDVSLALRPPGRRGAARRRVPGRGPRRRRAAVARPDRPRRRTSCGRCCTVRAERTARSATSWTCSTSPYVGSTPAACRVAWDKPVAKSVARAAGLSTPGLGGAAARHVPGAGRAGRARVDRASGSDCPLVVKPARGGSALGVSVVRAAGELPRAMVDCFAYGDVALVERFVDGVEVAVSVVDAGDGPLALPAVEIVADGGMYDYDARYTAGATEFFCPARLTDAATFAVREAALTAHRAFGLRHLSRTDLIVDRLGRPWFLEVNVAPGMTETSLLPQAVEAAEENRRTAVPAGGGSGRPHLTALTRRHHPAALERNGA